jgi:hypothetical protein
MWKQLFQSRATTKADIWLGVGGLAFAIIKLLDTVHQYKTEQMALTDKNFTEHLESIK